MREQTTEPNHLEIDEARLNAEADAAIAGLPPVTGPGAADAAQQPPEEPWGPFLHTSVRPVLFGLVLNQWEVTPEEQQEWTEALGQCMDQLFPGGIGGKYACWVRLLMASGGIVGMRYVTGGGKLPPLFPPRRETATIEHKPETVSAPEPSFT